MNERSTALVDKMSFSRFTNAKYNHDCALV